MGGAGHRIEQRFASRCSEKAQREETERVSTIGEA
jgi:hypothetical protein